MISFESIRLLFSPFGIALNTFLLLSLWFVTEGNSLATNCTPEQRRSSAVLVTGASRGIGKSIALELHSLGYTVFGSVRSQSSYDELKAVNANNHDDNNNNPNEVVPTGSLIPLQFDVTNDDEIEDALEIVGKECQDRNLELIAIVNNAAINPEGDRISKHYLEKDTKLPDNVLSDSDTVTKVFDTNVIGCFRVSRAFLPLLPKDKGRIILIGSYFGTIAGALGLSHLAYESSKFALEGLSDGLRRGLKKEGIKVSLIKPGNIMTDMNMVGGEVTPDVVSRDVLSALEAKNPKARYYPGTVKGLPCKLLCRIFDLLPSWFTDKQL